VANWSFRSKPALRFGRILDLLAPRLSDDLYEIVLHAEYIGVALDDLPEIPMEEREEIRLRIFSALRASVEQASDLIEPDEKLAYQQMHGLAIAVDRCYRTPGVRLRERSDP
jgi:hypothetical protein